MNKSIVVERAGDLVWGCTSRAFKPTGSDVSVLIAHNGESPLDDWIDRFHHLERNWDSLRQALSLKIPGGLGNSTLHRIDFRPDRNTCSAILHFKTNSDIYDWYVRLDSRWQIGLVAQKD